MFVFPTKEDWETAGVGSFAAAVSRVKKRVRGFVPVLVGETGDPQALPAAPVPAVPAGKTADTAEKMPSPKPNQRKRRGFGDAAAASQPVSDQHVDLGRAPYVLYGVKYIDVVSPAPCSPAALQALGPGQSRTP